MTDDGRALEHAEFNTTLINTVPSAEIFLEKLECYDVHRLPCHFEDHDQVLQFCSEQVGSRSFFEPYSHPVLGCLEA